VVVESTFEQQKWTNELDQDQSDRLVGDGKQEFDDREVGEGDSFEAESKNKRGSVEVPDALAILRLGAENDEWEDGEW
jgi:hypothetical protein